MTGLPCPQHEPIHGPVHPLQDAHKGSTASFWPISDVLSVLVSRFFSASRSGLIEKSAVFPNRTMFVGVIVGGPGLHRKRAAACDGAKGLEHRKTSVLGIVAFYRIYMR